MFFKNSIVCRALKHNFFSQEILVTLKTSVESDDKKLWCSRMIITVNNLNPYNSELGKISSLTYEKLADRDKFYLTLSISGYLTNWKDQQGGRSAPHPPCYMAIRGYFHFFSNRDIVLDIKDQNPKAQPSTFKIVALRSFWKYKKWPRGGSSQSVA